MGHQVSSSCLRRGPFQVRCLDPDCVECEGIYLDLTFIWSLFVAPLLARSLLRVLPLKDGCTAETHGYGNIGPKDIDWERLESGKSKFL